MPRVAATGPAREAAAVSTPHFQVTFGADGAVTAWTLKYRGAKPLAVGAPLAPLAVAVTRTGRAPEVVALAPEAPRLEIAPGQPPASLRFAGVTGDGVRIYKILEFHADRYVVGVRLGAEGLGTAEDVALALYWTGPVAEPWGPPGSAPLVTIGAGPEGQQLLGRILLARAPGVRPEVFEAPAPAIRDRKETPAGPELKDPQPVETMVVPVERGWVGLENDYVIAALIADRGGRLLRGRDRDLAQAALVFPAVQWQPGRPWEGRGEIYVGPKEWEQLKAVGVGLEQAQARNYGCFPLPCDYGGPMPMEWVTVPLLWLLNFFARALPGQNYGIAIILLTLLVKVVFYPLSHKSMTSMKQMQALQPQLNALRNKYRSDPQRFQREQMDLYRKHRVNPMGGCLPMIVQIPIFYALYLTLQYSVELQGAPFVGWITDLSKKDPYYVLPILMGASMLVQQKMTPTVGDPRQAKIMLFMPVIFTFMFLEFPTGLVLYWLVNNVLQIAQQMVIDRTAGARVKTAVIEGKPDKEPRKA
ncbi:MAG TPA: membrane protein insertase YidC [Methylomirabilota bacterium]|nr:membrane protein insertase YidC [Methylomirabilota bacterium]